MLNEVPPSAPKIRWPLRELDELVVLSPTRRRPGTWAEKQGLEAVTAETPSVHRHARSTWWPVCGLAGRVADPQRGPGPHSPLRSGKRRWSLTFRFFSAPDRSFNGGGRASKRVGAATRG